MLVGIFNFFPLQESNFRNPFEQIRQIQPIVQGAEELRKLSRAIRPPKPVWVSGKANAVGQSSPKRNKVNVFKS